MKPSKIRPHQSAYHDEPSNVKLESIQDQRYPQNRTHQIQKDIFQHLGVKFKINQIHINQEESLHTIFVQTLNKQKRNICFFLSHGFGGSSLMYFPIIRLLVQYGNVVLWQIRGMGLSKKLQKYHVSLQDSQAFFVQPIQLMLKFYSRYNEIFFISHSFGGYLTLLYILKFKTFLNNIKEVILLSPVGITPKEDDYKSKVHSLSDIFHVIGNKLSWTFHLTYKSPFRCICSCFKNRVFKDAVKQCGFTPEEQILMKDLLITMVDLQDGSEGVFFRYFQPRVLPKFPILPIFNQCPPVRINFLYGGQQDWVDKKGAQIIKEKFPEKISMKIVKQCGHNFPFFPQQLKKNLQQILLPYKLSLQTQTRKKSGKKSNICLGQKVQQSGNHTIENSVSNQNNNFLIDDNSDECLKHAQKNSEINSKQSEILNKNV